MGELLQLYASLSDKTDFYWNFYFAAIAAVLGWLFARSKPLRSREKGVLTALYLMFVVMNILALTNTYGLMKSCALVITDVTSTLTIPTYDVDKRLLRVARAGPWLAWVIHILVDVMIILGLWTGFFIPSAQRTKPKVEQKNNNGTT